MKQSIKKDSGTKKAAAIHGVAGGIIYNILSGIPAVFAIMAMQNAFSALGGGEAPSFSFFSLITIFVLGIFTLVSPVLFGILGSWVAFFIMPTVYKKQMASMQNFSSISTAYFVGILIIVMILLKADIKTIIINCISSGLPFWLTTRVLFKKNRYV